ADLSVRGNRFGKVIPDYDAVIFDEAHLIEDIASDYFGFQVSNFQIDELVRDADQLPITDPMVTREITRISAKIRGLAEQFWMRFQQARFDGRYPLTPDLFAYRESDGTNRPTPLGEAYLALDGALGALVNTLEPLGEASPEADSLVRRCRQTRFELEF